MGSEMCIRDRASSVTACTKPSTLAPMTLMGNLEGYSMSESLRGSLACSARPLAGGGVVGVMMKSPWVFASVSIAGGAVSLCARGLVARCDPQFLRAPIRCRAVRFVLSKSLACHHNGAGLRTGHAPGLRVFADCHGFLLIIRGFVKVAVCNAGVIQQ